MHLFKDLVIPKVVDDEYQPVPAGQSGDRLLVTVLSSRTIPLIRYERTDRVRLATHTCPCGLPFRLLDAIEGRIDDALQLSTSDGGSIRVHPVVFHKVLDLLDGAGRQVRQEPDRLRVLIAGAAPGSDPDGTEHAVTAALVAAGAKPPAVPVPLPSVAGAQASRVIGVRPKVSAGLGRWARDDALVVQVRSARW